MASAAIPESLNGEPGQGDVQDVSLNEHSANGTTSTAPGIVHQNGTSVSSSASSSAMKVPNQCVATSLHTLSLFDLTGKTALVTGGNGGIGSGMAQGLAEAGADIIIFQIPGDSSSFPTKLAAETGRKVSVYDCDLGDTQAIRATVQKVLDDGHVIDILCNVAGVSSGSIPILEETDEHKDKVSRTL